MSSLHYASDRCPLRTPQRSSARWTIVLNVIALILDALKEAADKRVFLAIRDPSMVLAARLPDLNNVEYWNVSVGGAHGLDIDHQRGRLYAACDDAALVEVDIGSGKAINEWPLAGVPDVTFFNPATGLVHVAIGEPGLVQSIDPRSGSSTQIKTGAGAHTTAFVAPDRLYVFSPSHGGALILGNA